MMVKTERKTMGKSNKIKNTDRNGILLALEKDLEFIKSVATNHKNWNEETAKAVTKLIGWGSVERVLKIGKKARSLKKVTRKRVGNLTRTRFSQRDLVFTIHNVFYQTINFHKKLME
jgi:hypothetical protein